MAKATQQDFDNLIERIDVATTDLEEAVEKVASGEVNVEEAAKEAKEAAREASSGALQAQAHAVEAKGSSVRAENAKVASEAIKEELLNTVPYSDAPSNGITYGRKDGEWQPVEAGGGGGTDGGVITVNNKAPDSKGNVQLAYEDLDNLPEQFSGDYNDLTNKPELFSGDYEDLTNLPQLFSGSYNDLTDKPEIPTGGVEEAPEDGKQYARKDGEWVEVEASNGGGGSGGSSGWTNHNPTGFKYSKELVKDLKNNSLKPTFEDAEVAYVMDTDASTPATNNPFEYVDIRAFQYKDDRLRFGSEIVDGYDPSTGMMYEFKTELKFFLRPALNSNYLRDTIPAGKYFIPSGLTTQLSENEWTTESGFPKSLRGSAALLTVEEWGTPKDDETVIKRKLTITFTNSYSAGGETTFFYSRTTKEDKGKWWSV